jgi:hypothetical protein
MLKIRTATLFASANQRRDSLSLVAEGSALFRSDLRGGGFHVVAGQALFCCDLLKDAGLAVGVIESED